MVVSWHHKDSLRGPACFTYLSSFLQHKPYNKETAASRVTINSGVPSAVSIWSVNKKTAIAQGVVEQCQWTDEWDTRGYRARNKQLLCSCSAESLLLAHGRKIDTRSETHKVPRRSFFLDTICMLTVIRRRPSVSCPMYIDMRWSGMGGSCRSRSAM